MSGIGLEITLVILLVLANGAFAMAEMAVVSARKARLRQKAEEGSKGAEAALLLLENPENFLSTVQIGITLIGTLAGAFGGATIAGKLAIYLNQFPVIQPYSESVSIFIVVLIISYLSLILGELVPKSIALGSAESIASLVAPPMQFLAKIGSPLVRTLTLSTKLVLKILPIRQSEISPVTEEEIKVLIAQGTEAGTFEESEQEMLEGVFRLGDRKTVDLMKPRKKVEWLDVEDPWLDNEKKVIASPYSRFPVAEGDLDRFLGMVHAKDLLSALSSGKSRDLRAIARKPLFVPESAPAMETLEHFQESGEQMAMVVDEHGSIQGIITLTDLIEAVVGDLRIPGQDRNPKITIREDGSWLVDGSMSANELIEKLDIRDLVNQGYTTVGGLVLAQLHRIPETGDHFHIGEWRFEVVDMDGNRVDKVLVEKLSEESPPNNDVY